MPHAPARPAASRPALPDVLLEHLEETAFLWIQRRVLLFSEDVPLRRMPQHDERIEAQLDALRIGGAASVEAAAPLLEEGNPWLVASALWTWLTLGAPAPADAFAKLEGMPEALDPSWREALRWADEPTRDRLFPPESAGRLPPRALAIAIEPLTESRRLESTVAQLAARSPSASVRGSLARVLAWPGTGDVAHALLPLLVEDEEPGVRRRARWSAALRDPATALDRTRRARPEQCDAHDVRIVGLLGEPEDASVLARLAEHDPLRPAALLALGDLGSWDAVETLLRVLAVPDPEAQAQATAGLERALGALPAEPTPLDGARGRWQEVAEELGDASACRGRARPWEGEASEEPAWWTWRAAIRRPTQATRRWAREVPNGFWDARESLVSEAGA